jgi:hemolysin activation/secretion protein
VVGGDLAAPGLNGQAEIYGITWLHPLVRATDASSNMHLGFASKTIENFVLLDTPVSKDEIREVTLGFDTNFVIDRARTLLSGVITQGLGTALGGSDNGVGTSRAGAGNEFSKVNVEAFHIRDLRQNQFLLARFSGQYADRPLVVAEQFAMGGADSVRGYFQSEFLGDDGYTASLEYRLRLHSGPKLQLQGAMFIDHGDARVKNPQVGEVGSRSFTGAGVGLRASVFKNTTLRLDVGYPITEDNQLLEDEVIYGSSVSRW